MFQSRGLPAWAVVAVVLWSCGINWGQAESVVVINELHVDPDVKTELVEFIELYNAGAAEVDLAGWQFTEGVLYTFPAGTKLPAGKYIIVAQSPAGIKAKWNVGRVVIPENLICGPWTGGLSNEGERVVLRDAAGAVADEVEYQMGFPWPTVGDPVPNTQPGTGCSMQLVNPAFDNDLGGSWRSALPTPAAVNKDVLTDNVPPQVRQVKHSPQQPKSGEVVTITAKITDADGVASVSLLYQLVNPGSYIARFDPGYSQGWTMVPMHDEGLDGDARAGDDVYTVQMPAGMQTHRRLVRYRIFVMDGVGLAMTVPYADDPQPNFAYFVYDGVPAWRGAVQPGVTPVVEFPAEVMQSLPVYHLLSKKSDVEDCTWLSKYSGSEYRWYGTLVYDGDVYDHVRYRARGGVWRYSMGKNMWKFDFQRGHSFQARDDYGNPYKTTWNKLNFSACIQQGSFGQRGEQGMFEALSFRLFNLAGCPASNTNYVYFRIIDETDEDGTRNASHSPLTTSGTQYDGDFWGLYMTIEQMDGRFLDEHGLPDGNLYKMEGGGVLNNQGPTQPSNQSDLNQFLGYGGGAESWWRQNVNLDAYYGYYAIYQAIHDGDITSKNWFLYHNPETNQWWQLPWDKDLTWTTYYGSNDPTDPFGRAGLLNISSIGIENKNRLREITDLLFNADQTNQLIDEYAGIINDPAGGLSMVDADRAMWDYHWVVGTGAYPKYLDQSASFKAGQGRFYQSAVDHGYPRTFEGMVQVMKGYVVERTSYLNSKTADSAIPNTPMVSAVGAAGFPINALTFRTSAFSDPQGVNSFAAMQWRIAEVAASSKAPVQQNASGGIVLVPDGATWKYFKGTKEPSTPQSAWRQLNFNDSAWHSGPAAIGYGETFIATNLNDMRGGYTSVYVRKTFDVVDLTVLDKLSLEVKYDDGINVWINGKLARQDNVSGENLPYNALATAAIENWEFVPSDLGDPRTWLVEGTNVIAVQVLNASLGDSSDCFIDVRLTGQRSANAPSTGATVSSQISRKVPGKYEIDATWQSGEIKTYNSNITIPATAAAPGRTYRVRCRMKDNTGRWSHWSSPVQFVAGEPLAAGILENLRITEVMYNPPALAGDGVDNNEFEFIEIKNIGDEALNLSGVSFDKGVTFSFAGGSVTSLAPGKFALVVKNKQAFLSCYGSALAGLIAGEYLGKLANDGETIALVDLWNGTIAEFEYGDGRGWPQTADGAGHSLVPLDAAVLTEPQGSLNYPGNWRASTYLGGSPGQDDPAPPATVLINEFLANAPPANPPQPIAAAGDWIELYNPTDASVNLAGWYLSDDASEPGKWAIPAVSIPAHGYVTFDETAGFGAGSTGFGLSKDGEQVVLSCLPATGVGRIADCVPFKAQEQGISLGRYPDGGSYWFRLTPSRDAANKNPVLDVVIDEIMYHPVDPNEEYIELYNPTTRAVDLHSATASWRLDGAVGYTFPAGVSIPVGGRLVVVGFDPMMETSRYVAFLAAYRTAPLVPGMTIVGPWTGNLSNHGERVALEKSQPGDNPADPIAWVLVDEVIYSDVAPWPAAADGQGSALQRVHAEAAYSGNDPTNWKAAPPTPGK
ncbi:MAG: lamin tail domain-containing protein [Phycisphaerae bacterium]|nr:lamin tail domain-containing protein [Phycisphaerae bacterium]